MAKQLTFADNDPVTGGPTVDGFAGWTDQLLDGIPFRLWPVSDEPGYSNGGRATFDLGTLTPAVIQCVKGLGQDFLYMSFLVRFNQNDSPVTPGGGPFSNDDVIVLALRSAFAPAVHDSNTVRFDIYPIWNGIGADEPGNPPSVSAGTPDDTLSVDGQTFTNTWHIRNGHSPRHVDFYQGVAGGGWTPPTNVLPDGVQVKVHSYKPLVPAGNTQIGCWSIEVRLPITIPDGNGGVRMQTSFGVYANLVRVGIGPTTPFQNFDHQTQYIWPQPGTPLTGTLTSCPIDPGAYGQGYIPDFDSPPGANTGKGVQFFQWPGGVPGVGAVVAPTSTSVQPDDTIHGSKDNTLVAQVVNTDPSINAPNVTADFHFANWGLGPAQFPLWSEAQGANPMPTAPTTIPAGGALTPLTSDWAAANIPTALKGTHQCVWVVLNSNQEVQFIQDSVRRNMNIATLSEHRATAEVSGKGYPPPPSGSNHRFVLVASAFAEPIIPEIVIESPGPHLAELFDAAAPPAVVWHWFTFGFVRRPDEVLVINKRKYEAWLPAPGGFGILAGHDHAEHPLNSDLLGPGVKRLARGVYELPVPHNGSVKIQTVLTAAPPAELPPTIRQGSTGPAVRQCQFLLSVEGYGIGPAQINGKFDATMKAVVERFQRANGLPVDGVVGPKSWTELIADAPVQTEIFVPPFDHSDTVFVTRLQQTLNGARKWFAAGAAPLAEDGRFGPATQALVKAVQTWGAIQSTGTPNDQTWAISVGPTIWDVAGPGTAGTKPHPEPTVRMGSKGEAVQIAQFLLSAQGFGLAPRQVDGNFGQATHDAVVRFQRAHKLTADGVVGPGTWKQLFAHPPVAETPPTLHHGASGPVVRALQTALNQAAGRFAVGQRPLTVDGSYGPATVARVKEFQRWGEVIIDGIMGYRTWSVSVGASLWTQ